MMFVNIPLVIIGAFITIIAFKYKIRNLTRRILYLEEQDKIRSVQQFKASLYEAAMIPSTIAGTVKGYGYILTQVVRKIEESISFLDNQMPLFKEDFKSILNKLYDWITYFIRKEKAKDHALLQPDKINLEKLMRKVEMDLVHYMNDPPKILLKTISYPNRELDVDIVCDVNQVVYSLIKAVLRIGTLGPTDEAIVHIQLHPTSLQFKQTDSIDSKFPSFMEFKAIAIVISDSTIDEKDLPKIKKCYEEINDTASKSNKKAPPSIDLEQDTISSMVHAHYGYLETSFDKKKAIMLMVLPCDVNDIIDKMRIKVPIDSFTSETPMSPKEQADSMMELMKFHDHVVKSLCKDDPVDMKIISSLILLLREHFKFKRHISGQLFYVRAVGIASIVVDWVFHSPKVIYASLLYELVRRTCLPISYIKEHYNLGVYAFVFNVVNIDKRKELDHPSLFHIENRLEEALKEDHVQLSVLFIKLAERLYDLRNASGYIDPREVYHMAEETLTIDIQIAGKHLGPEIGQELEYAAKEALKVCKHKEQEKNS